FIIKIVSISILLAILITYMLKPVVTYLERISFSKPTSISIVFCTISAIGITTAYLLAPLISDQFNEIQKELPRYKEGFENICLQIEAAFNDRLGSFYQLHIYDTVIPYLQKHLISYIETLPQQATDFFTVLLLAPFFAFFLLRDGT